MTNNDILEAIKYVKDTCWHHSEGHACPQCELCQFGDPQIIRSNDSRYIHTVYGCKIVHDNFNRPPHTWKLGDKED